MVMDRKIETKSVQEGLKLVFRQKLFAVECQKEGSSVDQYARMVAVDKEISSCMSQNFEKQKRDEEEEL